MTKPVTDDWRFLVDAGNRLLIVSLFRVSVLIIMFHKKLKKTKQSSYFSISHSAFLFHRLFSATYYYYYYFADILLLYA